MADGPLPWGRPLPTRRPGVFIVELPAPLPTAPIELTRVGKWLERVPSLALDGAHPSSRALAARLASFWLPSQTVLYIGASASTLSGRVAAMEGTVLGDRRPHSGGHWLHVLRVLPSTRLWWTATDATEEYEDALLTAFAAAVPAAERAALPDTAVVLPFANLRSTTERRASGITGSLLPDTAEPPPPPTRVTVLPDGDAEGARGEPPERRPRAAPKRATSAAGTGTPSPRPPAGVQPGRPAVAGETATLTADGAARMQTELDELIRVKRPEVIARIRAAKELGDLKENADYTSAREEQSFLEGRIQSLEAQLRAAVIAVAPSAGSGADLGSRLTVEVDGMTDTYTLVGTAEADPSAGRLSVASPVGRALVGARAGSVVEVKTPRGGVTYRVIDVE